MEPTNEQMEALRSDPDVGPVVMLNLVRCLDRSTDGNGSGEDAYFRYSRGFMPILKRSGGTILWAGSVSGVVIGDGASNAWDYAVLVQYPSKQVFVDAFTSPEYKAINPLRLAGLANHVILPISETYSKFTPST